jgi:hypothetical protein
MDSKAFNINNRFWNDNFDEKQLLLKVEKSKELLGKSLLGLWLGTVQIIWIFYIKLILIEMSIKRIQ